MSTAERSASLRPSRRSRPLRLEDAESYWFVTSRTLEQVFWLHPLLCSELQPVNREARRQVARKRARLDERLAKLVRRRNKRFEGHKDAISLEDAKERAQAMISGALARARELYAREDSPPVEIFSVVAMSNHLHLVLRAPGKNLSAFVGKFLEFVAKDINWLLGRTGPVFPRRFDAQPLLDEGALHNRVAYTLNNPVAAGLVEEPGDWPGFVAVAGLARQGSCAARYFDATAWYRAAKPKDRSPFWREASLPLHRLPGHEHQSDAQYLQQLMGWTLGEGMARPDRVLGIDGVLNADVDRRPARPRHSRRPYAFGSKEATLAYREAVREVLACYQQCIEQLRRGERDITWPPGTYAPGVMLAA